MTTNILIIWTGNYPEDYRWNALGNKLSGVLFLLNNKHEINKLSPSHYHYHYYRSQTISIKCQRLTNTVQYIA